MAKHRVCPHCNQKFKMKDEVVLTDARGGGTDLVHSDCLYDWVLNCSLQTYFETYKEFLSSEEND